MTVFVVCVRKRGVSSVFLKVDQPLESIEAGSRSKSLLDTFKGFNGRKGKTKIAFFDCALGKKFYQEKI